MPLSLFDTQSPRTPPFARRKPIPEIIIRKKSVSISVSPNPRKSARTIPPPISLKNNHSITKPQTHPTPMSVSPLRGFVPAYSSFSIIIASLRDFLFPPFFTLRQDQDNALHFALCIFNFSLYTVHCSLYTFRPLVPCPLSLVP